MWRVLYILLNGFLFFGCRVIENPNYFYPEIIKRAKVDSVYMFEVKSNDTTLISVWEFDLNGNPIYKKGKNLNNNEVISYIRNNEYSQRISEVTYSEDSIRQLAFWRYDAKGKLVSAKSFENIDSLSDTLTPSEYVYFNYNSHQNIDTIYYFNLYEDGDTILDSKYVKYNNKKILTINNLRSYPDTIFHEYDFRGRIKHIIHQDKSSTKFVYKGRKKGEAYYYNRDGFLSSLEIYHFNKNLLLTKEYSFSCQKDSTIQDFICGVQEYRDTSFYNYSVKPTIYLYKYTKRK